MSALVAFDEERTDLAALLGADRFYAAGIDGAGASAAVVEGGLVWNGDASTSHVSHYHSEATTWRYESGFNDERDLWDRHATYVGGLLGGRGPSAERTGIAPGVDLASGGFARRWVGGAYSLSWTLTTATALSPYRYFTETHAVDVINSSWGFTDSAGRSDLTRQIDALAAASPQTLFVAAAGNSGSSTNSVVGPAGGMNVLAVGGLAYAEGRYDQREPSSSRGLSDYWDPVNGTVSAVRASVDILAPGRMLTTVFYGGQTGGNNPTLTGSFSQATRDAAGIFGTSFAAPIVSGGASLLYAASYEYLPDNADSRDSRVIRAVLLNSAVKLDGWSAAVTDEGGVATTRQGLDAAQGAGRADLNEAWSQYLPIAGATDGLDTGALNLIGQRGWDLATLERGDSIFYDFGWVEDDLWTLTSTLAWHRERQIDGSNNVSEVKQSNLDLLLWQLSNDSPEWTLIAQSISEYNTVEHLFVALEGGADYRLEVRYGSDTFALFGAGNEETFALAWDLALIPEPMTFAWTLGLFAFLLALRRRRR